MSKNGLPPTVSNAPDRYTPDQPTSDTLPEGLNPVLYRILNEADPELAGYYLGAYKTLSDTTNPERYANASHSLRELIEKLPEKHARGVKLDRPQSILSTTIYEARDAWETVEIDKTSQHLWKLPETEDSNKFLRKSEKFWNWFIKHYPKREEIRLKFLKGAKRGAPLPSALEEKQLARWGEYQGRFAKIAHHREKPTEFNKLLAEFEEFLIRELDPQTTKDFFRISELIKEVEADKKGNLQELVGLIRANRPNYDHFFFNISAPLWLQVLEDSGLLYLVDEPVPTDNGGYMLLPWSAGAYYEKVAHLEPEKISGVISGLPKTENTRVHEQLVDLAKKMPAKQAVVINPFISDWLKGRYANHTGLLPFKVGEYIVGLANDGAYNDALVAFRALFELLPPPETKQYFRHPETLTSDTSYKTLLQDTVPTLMGTDPKKTIEELCKLLYSGLEIERDGATEKDGLVYDGSTIWRPDIKQQKYDHEPNEILVTVLWEALSGYATAPKNKLEVIDLLTQYKYEVFHRIAATLAEGDTDPQVKAKYDEIAKKTGEPNHPDYISMETTVVPALSVEDMQKLSSGELIELLNNWDPKEDLPGFGRSRSDIGFVLTQYAERQPEVVHELLRGGAKLNLEYYSYLFRGVRQASDNKQVAIEWEPILKVGKEFIQASNTATSEGDERQAQFDLINAVESGLNHDQIKVADSKLAADILGLFVPLCSHAEPTREDEAKHNKSNGWDSLSLAINTMRGEALSHIVALLKNISRQTKNKLQDVLTDGQQKAIFDLLEAHLDTSADPSLAVRTVYARELPLLAYVNLAWAKKNIAKIFPLDEGEQTFFATAVEVFLETTKPYPEVFPLVSPYIVEYMKRTQTDQLKGDDDRVKSHLVSHILFMYLDDYIAFDDPAMQELAKMPASVLVEAMDFFGRGFKQTSGERQQHVVAQAKSYWEWRLKAGNVSEEEYGQLGWWFRSGGAFNDEWLKQHFLDGLDHTSKMGSLYFVTDRLVEMAKSNPQDVSVYLLKIIETQTSDNLLHMLHEPGLKGALAELLQSTDQEARDNTVHVIDKLCAMGYYAFKDLIQTNQPDQDN